MIEILLYSGTLALGIIIGIVLCAVVTNYLMNEFRGPFK